MNNNKLGSFYQIGRLGKTFGVQGELRLHLDQENLLENQLFKDAYVFVGIDGFKVPFQIGAIASDKGLIQFQRIHNEAQLKELVGKDLFIVQDDQSDLKPSGKLLDGFTLINHADDETIGRIISVEEFPAHPMAFVQFDDAEEPIMIPLVDEWMRDIDPSNLLLWMDLPDGLVHAEEE